AQSGQSAGGTADSRMESESAPGSPEQQPSVGESSVVIHSSSYSTGHTYTQPSPAQNLNTGAGGGCEVEPDVADAVLPAEVVAVVLLLLPLLP
ncbi:hypothetical protein A2U01_0079067, partial [Trifolium medium]|nr:hypothetical protein [Trifolium medium]